MKHLFGVKFIQESTFSDIFFLGRIFSLYQEKVKGEEISHSAFSFSYQLISLWQLIVSDPTANLSPQLLVYSK